VALGQVALKWKNLAALKYSLIQIIKP
jgi:hypothetical protein